MKIKIFMLITLIAIVSCNQIKNEKPENLQIGNFYADVLHGITFKYDNNQAFLFRIGYLDSKGNYIVKYKEHEETLPDHSGQKFGPSAPDYSYNKYGFTTDSGNIIWIEWSVLENGENAVGKVYSNSVQEIYLEVMQAWPDAPNVSYFFSDTGFKGKLNKASKNEDWIFSVLNKEALGFYVVADSNVNLSEKIAMDTTTEPEKGREVFSAAQKYRVSANEPLYFTSGENISKMSTTQIDQRLSECLEDYSDVRFAIETPFGEIWEAVSNHHNSTRVYGTQSKLSAHVISRGWCKGYNQQLYEWDSFFQGMLASIEDPEGGKETIRTILKQQTPIGIVPNVALGNDSTQNSNDRSQPPVGAICVWKMHQYHPDINFLKEVYPKLLKWHNWWFEIRPENGLPYRDGNQNGLLEWGTEIGTSLQFAKYESGQDNSPMFDDVRMNEKSYTIELDMAGLSGLWAADALYLSFIADAIGKTEEAQTLRKQAEDMNRRINEILWNEETGMYCNKYWDEYSRKPKVESFKNISVKAMNNSIRLSYQDTLGNEIIKNPNKIGLSEKELKETGLRKRAYKKYVREENPVKWKFTLTPEETGAWFFYVPEEMGVLITFESEVILDNRLFWVTEYISDPVYMEKGKTYQMELDYTGDIPFELQWSKEQKHEGSLFSERLGPTLFYPLMTGAASAEQGERVIANLLNPDLFWGEYVLPTIARNDPAFGTQGYWRGRIWPPTNYLAYLGIKNYAPDKVTWEYALKSAHQAQNEWIKRGHLYENYYSEGPGAGDPHYCWGGLMQLIMLEELVGIDNGSGEWDVNHAVNGKYVIKNFPGTEKPIRIEQTILKTN